MKKVDIVIVGGGPAGMAAALGAYEAGIRNMLILERDNGLGGILQQCIHNGFGLHRFGEELTGPEYAQRYADRIAAKSIPYLLNTMALDITPDKVVTAINSESGIFQIQAQAIILAMGCRERSSGALCIPGSRPAGVYTAGTAQRFVNIKGLMPGKKVVILGSGDIGLIMARRMTLEGAEVKMVCELLPFSGGLNRNIVQCLNDFNIPLKLSHTVSEIHGNDRLTGVTISKVDDKGCVIPEQSEFVECDTLLLSCGLIPENELSRSTGISIDSVTGGAIVDERRETAISGIFSCGNVLHVHDLVDYVSEEAELAGRSAAEYIKSDLAETARISLTAGNGVRYTVPQKISMNADLPVKVYFRVGAIYENAGIIVRSGDCVLLNKKKRKMAPGEMEYLEISPEMIRQIKNNAVIEIIPADHKA